MLRIVFTPTARRDLSDIGAYIAVDHPINAERVLRGIRRHVQALAANPAMGRSRPEVGEEVRSFPSGTYMIFYRLRRDMLEVLAVVHGARDIRRALGDREL